MGCKKTPVRDNGNRRHAQGSLIFDRTLAPTMRPTDDLTPNTDEMQAMQGRIADIQERRRGRIRWHITKHTAELAIAALAGRAEYRRSGKCRRRKKRKRLL
jgi:hypothetical protein